MKYLQTREEEIKRTLQIVAKEYVNASNDNRKNAVNLSASMYLESLNIGEAKRRKLLGYYLTQKRKYIKSIVEEYT